MSLQKWHGLCNSHLTSVIGQVRDRRYPWLTICYKQGHLICNLTVIISVSNTTGSAFPNSRISARLFSRNKIFIYGLYNNMFMRRYPFGPWGPFYERFSIVIQIRWKSYSALIDVEMKRSLWHFSCGTTAVLSLACAKFCSDMMHYSEVTLTSIFHRIWIRIEKSFVKWAPGLVSM